MSAVCLLQLTHRVEALPLLLAMLLLQACYALAVLCLMQVHHLWSIG
jgi:hypothetical protein